MDPNVPGSSNPQPGSSDPFRRNPDGTLPDDMAHPPPSTPASGASPAPPAAPAPATPAATGTPAAPAAAPDTHTHPS